MKGYTTIHAGSARQALTRLRFVCQLSDTDLPLGALTSLVADTVDLVVHTSRTASGPQLSEILAVEDLANNASSGQFTVTDLFRRDGPGAPLSWTGQVPARLDRVLRAAGLDARALLAAGQAEAHR